MSPNLVIEMFNNAPSSNRVEVVATVDQILRLLKSLPNERSSEQRRSVVNVTKAHVFSE